MNTENKNELAVFTKKEMDNILLHPSETFAAELIDNKATFGVADLWNIQRKKATIKAYRRTSLFL